MFLLAGIRSRGPVKPKDAKRKIGARVSARMLPTTSGKRQRLDAFVQNPPAFGFAARWAASAFTSEHQLATGT